MALKRNSFLKFRPLAYNLLNPKTLNRHLGKGVLLHYSTCIDLFLYGYMVCANASFYNGEKGLIHCKGFPFCKINMHNSFGHQHSQQSSISRVLVERTGELRHTIRYEDGRKLYTIGILCHLAGYKNIVNVVFSVTVICITVSLKTQLMVKKSCLQI